MLKNVLLGTLLAFPVIVACGASTDALEALQADLETETHHPHPDAGSTSSSGGSSSSGSSSDSTDDGAPTPVACTSSFGDGLNGGSHGRLDGYLVSVVVPGGHGCNRRPCVGESRNPKFASALGRRRRRRSKRPSLRRTTSSSAAISTLGRASTVQTLSVAIASPLNVSEAQRPVLRCGLYTADLADLPTLRGGHLLVRVSTATRTMSILIG